MSITTTSVVITVKCIIDIKKKKTPHHYDTGFIFILLISLKAKIKSTEQR